MVFSTVVVVVETEEYSMIAVARDTAINAKKMYR